MDSSVDHQLQIIREATQAILQTTSSKPSLTLLVDWEPQTYDVTQTTLILPKGLQVLGSWDSLKIDYLTGQSLTATPLLTWGQELELKAVHKEYGTTLVTLFWVVLLFAWAYDLLFKKFIK